MIENKKRAVLIGAGVIEQAENIITIAGDMVLALDGGLIFCEKHGITPDYIIGDFDSLSEDKQNLLDTYPQECVMRLPKEKDDTDMLAAIKFAISKGITEFVIYGGLGGRLSHTIANIQCLMYLKERGMNGILLGTDTKAFLLQNETHAFDSREKGYLSVFAYSGCATGVTLKKLKYELEDAVLDASFPLGVSNEFIGKEAEVSVAEGTLLLVQDQ